MRFVELAPCFMVLSTVFVINRELANGVVSGKYFWFYAAMGVLAISSFFTAKEMQRAQNINNGLILLFGVITLFVSYFVNGSEAGAKHILLILIILLYFYFRIAFQTQKAARYWLPVFLMITGLIEAIWGLRQLYGLTSSQHSLFRLTGSFFNPGPYSCYLAVVLPVAFYYLLRHWICTKVRFRLRNLPVYLRWGIALLTFVSILTVLPAGMSRASWLGALGGCGAVLYLTAKTQRGAIASFQFSVFSFQQKFQPKILRSLRKHFALFTVSVIIVIVCTGMYYLKKDSADGRAFIWKNAFQTILNHPMGVGIGNFSGSYGDTQAAYFASGKGTEREEYVAGNPEYAFNEYLQICIEHGVIPFILFVGLMGYSLYTGFRRKQIAPAASLVVLLIVAGMSYPFSVLPFLVVMAFLLAMLGEGGTQMTQIGMIRAAKKYSICVLTVCMVITGGCLWKQYTVYGAYKKWHTDKILYSAGSYKDAVKAYEKLYPFLSDQIQFLFEYAQSLSKTEQYEESNRVLGKAVEISCDPMLYNIMGKNCQALKKYAEAEVNLLKSTRIVPNRVYPYYLLAHLYIETGDTVKAKEMAQLVQTKEPKVHSTAIREMRNEMKKIFPNE